MIARAGGQVVLVSGVIPGEAARVRIERVGKGVAYARVVAVDEPSADRRESTADPLCGGCLYAHIAYPRQLQLKAQVIADALARIGRLPWSTPIGVAASPEAGYRMRARLHIRGGRLGLFREGSHQVCDTRDTRQLLPASCDVLDQISSALHSRAFLGDAEVELSENVDASGRVVHIESSTPLSADVRAWLAGGMDGTTGVSVGHAGAGAASCLEVLSGDLRVLDVLSLGSHSVPLVHHVSSFFQGNRFLLSDLAAHVVEPLDEGEEVLDLYAGVGLFSVAAAATRRARVTAVEGHAASAADLRVNAERLGNAVTVIHGSVEGFTVPRRPPSTLIVDPPRTGMSREALRRAIAVMAHRVVYVSCDVATLARDTRTLVDAGYELQRVDGFDLFPNTPHVEAIARFRRTP